MSGTGMPLALVLPLSEAAAQVAEWTDRRNVLIREAHNAGWSLRQIAGAVDLSHTAIANILAR